ncbi:MAG: type I secretion system permease/ATPase [Pseudomonadota bacterium]
MSDTRPNAAPEKQAGAPAESAAVPADQAKPETADKPEVAEDGAPEQASEVSSYAPAARNPMRDWRIVLRRNLATVALFSIFVNLLMLTIPIYLFQVSDRVLSSRSVETLLMLTIMALGFIGVLSLLDILRRQVLGRVATQLETILGGTVVAGMVGAARIADTSSLQTLRSLHQVKSFISGPVMLMLFDAPMAPLYFIAVFLIHPHLGIISVASGVILFTIAVLNQKLTSAPLGRAGMHAARADAHAEALTRNSQVINAMGMLNEGILQWGREQASALTLQLGALDRNLWISGASKFTRLTTQIAMLGWGGYLALEGHLTGGMMIAASIIAGRGLQPLEGMIEGWRGLLQARQSYARICQMVETIANERPPLRLPKPKGRLAVDKLLYLPPGTKEPTLNGISFELQPGESLAILGPSGSGKSTLARILVGCLLPTAGKVRLDSTELRNWDRRQFGEYTGYLPQEVELFPATIKANIARMREDLPDEKVYDAAVLTGIHEMVCHQSHGYETFMEASGAPLSGGQKQRIALARAFFGDPALVVLDEPNANLDAAGEQALADTLKRAKERGITVVAVTQRPALLASVDKVLILRAGRVEAIGSPNEILHRVVKAPVPTAVPVMPPPIPATPPPIPTTPPPIPAVTIAAGQPQG